MAGNFNLLPIPGYEKEMLDDMYKAITQAELWTWMAHPSIPGDGGFMFSSHPEIAEISKKLKYTEHSGSSFGLCMRVMQKIARRGWDVYVVDVWKTPTCKCMREKGLVGWCGVAGGGVPAGDH
jgi:hypothetical protein